MDVSEEQRHSINLKFCQAMSTTGYAYATLAQRSVCGHPPPLVSFLFLIPLFIGSIEIISQI